MVGHPLHGGAGVRPLEHRGLDGAFYGLNRHFAIARADRGSAESPGNLGFSTLQPTRRRATTVSAPASRISGGALKTGEAPPPVAGSTWRGVTTGF